MAQAAADAAAVAAATSIVGGTNTLANNTFGSSSLTCGEATHAAYTPCAYASLNGFGGVGSSDTVSVDFPASVNNVSLTSDSSVSTKAVHVLITRPVTNTFTRLLGAGATTNIKAAATAAIVSDLSPIPILVLHPSLNNAFNVQGNPTITICGGPQRSIQVNSRSTTAAGGGGSSQVLINKGGPSDTSGNCSGTGSDFGVFGGPLSARVSYCWNFSSP
jgi:hypothetical protein